MKVVLGPKNRLAGTVIWKSPLIEVPTTTEQGGKGGPSGQEQTTYSYYVDIAIGLADTSSIPVSRIRKVWADTKPIFDQDGPTDKYTDLTFYDGTQTTPDPLMVAYKGVGNVPAYTGTSFIRITRLFLGDFGNRVPNLTTWLEQAASLSVAAAVGLLLERSGLLEAEYDVSRIPTCFKGQVISGVQAGADQLSPSFITYSLMAQEGGGKITIFPRGSETVVAVDEDDLTTSTSNPSAEPRKLPRTDGNDFEMPDEVNVRFINADNDLQQGNGRARRAENTSESTVTVDSQLTLSQAEGDALAAQVLWAAEAERNKVDFSLPARYIELQEGDAFETTVNGNFVRIVVSELNRGANFQIKGSGYVSQPHVYEQFLTAQSEETTGASAYRPPDTAGEFFDAPALIEAHTTRIGGYFAVCAVVSAAKWKGASVWRASDGVTFAKIADAPTEAVMGVTVRGPGDGPTLFPDTSSRIRVRLLEGTVESVSDADFYAGRNVCAVQTTTGEFEIIGFQTVDIIDSTEGIYELSNLIRGMRGTNYLTSRHKVSGARFILLKLNTSVGFVDMGSSSLGRSDYYKFPAAEGLVSDYDRIGPRAVSGLTMRPFSPANLSGVFDAGTGDLTGSWQRRSKLFASPYSSAGGGLSPDESPETYIVELRAGGLYAPIIRTKTITATQTMTYSAAEQIADGISPGTIGIYMTVYQVSQVVGRSPGSSLAIFP
jgi:hypothetical protein